MTKDATTKLMMRTCAAAALLALQMGPTALAQEAQTDEQAQQPEQQAQDTQQAQPSEQAQDGGPAGQQATQPDVLVATVGGEEILSSEVMTVLGMLPEPLRAQQPDMLVPIALDQLILRELILQEAQAQNLGEDPEVQQLVEDEAVIAQEDAMVQVWLQRELGERVTDEQIQQTYDRIAAGAAEGAEVPPLEQVRPQIEQQLRQQALGEIRASLHEDAEITFYGPEGEPIGEGVDQVQPGAAPEPMPEGEGEEGQQPG